MSSQHRRNTLHACEDCGAEFRRFDGHVGDDGERCAVCDRKAHIQGALDAGIPLSVIEGKTKLTDHFSQEYIDEQCGKNKGVKRGD